MPIGARLAGQPADHPRRRDAVAAGDGGDLHDQRGRRSGRRRGRAAPARGRAAERRRRRSPKGRGSSISAVIARPSRPCPLELEPDDLVGMPFFDTTADPPRIVLGYVRRDEPGIDLDDPRTIRYRDLADGHLGDDGITDYLTHTSHLRVARSPDGERFEVEAAPALLPATELEAYGVEDPRITEIDGVFHITYVSASRLGITTSALTTTRLPHVRATRRDPAPRSEGRRLLPGARGRTVPGVHPADARVVLPRARHLARGIARPGALGDGIARSHCPARHVGRGAHRRQPHAVPRRRRLARGLSRRRPHEPLRHGRDAARRRRPRDGAGAVGAPAARARARVRTIGVPARRRLPERARHARGRRADPRVLRRRRLEPGRRGLRGRPTSSPTSIRAETARPAHPSGAGRRARRAGARACTPTPPASSSRPRSRGSRASPAWTTRRACSTCSATSGRRTASTPRWSGGRAGCSSSCCGCRSRTDDG